MSCQMSHNASGDKCQKDVIRRVSFFHSYTKYSIAITIEHPITSLPEARRFMTDCFIAVGVSLEYADSMASILTDADYRGFGENGLHRLEAYIRDIQTGVLNKNATPEILTETESTAWVDGKNGLGPIIGKFCMNLAIKKAKVSGVGWVVAKECNHYGIASAYSMQALNEGMIGFTCCNSFPSMVPAGAIEAALGTNPLSLSAPALKDDCFVLDISTTTVARGKIEMKKKKGESIPEGWAFDFEGRFTTDPEIALSANRLTPLGGLEGGHKGTGLAMMVDLFSGILSGSNYGSNVRLWEDRDNPEKEMNLGMCFAAINPGDFAPGFQKRLSDLLNSMRKMTPLNPLKPVLVPGDFERQRMADADRAGGVHYVPEQHRICEELAKELRVKPLRSAREYSFFCTK